MTLETVLARGRAKAEAAMKDSCIITRTTATSTNSETGVRAKTTVTIYTGRCRFQQASPSGVRPTDAGEKHELQLPNELQLPISVVAVKTGDDVQCTGSLDPDLPGRTFRIRELMHKTHATARRLGIEEAT